MKRIISLCCVCCILFMSLAVPVRADDISNDFLFPVLDFSTANNSGKNFVYVADQSDVSFSLSRDMSVYYVEILFNSFYNINSIIATVGTGSSSLSIIKVSDSLYRAYGNLRGKSDSRILFTFDSDSGAWIEFYSVNVSTVAALDYTTTLNGVINYDNSSISYVKDPSVSTPANAVISYSGDFNSTDFVTELIPYEWKKYDFIDIQLMIDTQSIDSISCIMGQLNVPFSVSLVNNSNLATSHFISIRVDLRGLDRTSSDYPMIVITGNLNFDDLSLFAILNVSGLVSYSDTNSVLFFLKERFIDLNSWISSQTSALQTEMQDIVISVSMEFTNLKSNLDSFKSDLMSNIYAFRDEIWAFRHSIEAKFSSLESNFNSWIENQTNTLEAAIRGDTDPGDDFQDQVDQKDQELEDMAAVMDSVTKPAIQDINVSLDQYVKPADVQVLATPLTVFLEADLFRTMIIMSIILATVSYTLYGKR